MPIEKFEHLTWEGVCELSVEHNSVGVSKFTGNNYSGGLACLKGLGLVIILGYHEAILAEGAVP